MFGVELIIDADNCTGELVDKNHIQNFIDDLCELSKMKKKGETIFTYFEDNEFNRDNDIVGWTVFQCISLSNITIHINEISKTIYFQIFTCGKINETLIYSLFMNYFKPETIKKLILNRDAKDYNLPFISQNA